MRTLEEFLRNANVGVEHSGEGLHIGVALAEALSTGLEIVTQAPGAAKVAPIAVAIAEATLPFTGPALGLVGVFLALGSGYEAAREEIQNKAVASGFSQGFVAGILNMSTGTVSSLFARHGVIRRNDFDPEADVLEAKAYNRGLVAGYAMARLASQDEKKAFVFEIRKFTGDVPVGDWGDRAKRDYVIEYAAKLRLHFLHV